LKGGETMKYDVNLYLIRKRRETLGLTNLDMAKALGFKHGANYYKYESGEYQFKLSMLPTISHVLGIKYDDFFTLKSAKTELRKKVTE
jgi:transcriptional regulator with XRE-family HTH domain